MSPGASRSDSGPASRPVLCFVHLEKAAGSTFHLLLQRNHPTYMTLAPFYWPAEPDEVVTAAEVRTLLRLFPFTPGIGGHSVRSYLGYEEAVGRPFDYVTFLREPVARVLSHVNYQRTQMGIDWTIEAFLGEGRFDNLMTRKLCGAADLDLAKRELRDRFRFVGLTERYDESLVLLREALGLDLDIRYEHQNVATDAGYRTQSVEPAVLDAIRERNALDLELYDFVVDELYPAARCAYGPTLERDVAAFQEANEGFVHPRSRRELARVYRWLGYRNVEMFLRRRHHPDADWGLNDAFRYRIGRAYRRFVG